MTHIQTIITTLMLIETLTAIVITILTLIIITTVILITMLTKIIQTIQIQMYILQHQLELETKNIQL